jgi:hypothetical protein
VTKRHGLTALGIKPLFEFAPIGTVDSFQGQERDIIAITLTRSNPQGEIGFLSDIRRMNVGMTRARRKLLLVGDSSVFWGVVGLCEGGGELPYSSCDGKTDLNLYESSLRLAFAISEAVCYDS